MTTTEELQRELANASRVIGALICKLDRAKETIKGLEATIESLRQERDRERLAHAKSWDAMSARIARLEEAGDAMANVLAWSAGIAYRRSPTALAWRKAKEDKP